MFEGMDLLVVGNNFDVLGLFVFCVVIRWYVYEKMIKNKKVC